MSDFVQGKKLKALIQNESLDNASADSFANLFQQAMAKNREYEYDQIKKKTTRVPKGLLKSSKAKHMRLLKQVSILTFHNQPTQTSIWNSPLHLKNHSTISIAAYMTLPKRPSVLEHMLRQKFLEQVVDNHVRSYLNRRRELRQEDSNRQCQEMAAKFADEVMKESVKLLKRKRIATPPNKSPTVDVCPYQT
ncbi:hypothetical protein Plhal304r1_c092g0172111 [Plasmopara halstedii]